MRFLAKSKKRPIDRILWNERPTNPAGGGGDIDEIVLDDVMVHVEQMDDRCWWIGIYRDGASWSGHFIADSRGRMRFSEQENDGFEWDRDDSHEVPT